MQAHHQTLARPDSPTDNHTHQHIHPQDSMYQHQNGMYSSSVSDNTIHMLPEYVTDHKLQQQHKIEGHSNTYRANFNSFPNANTTRQRNQITRSALPSNSYRDTNSFYPTSTDIFPPQMTSPTQSHMQAYESRSSYDFAGGLNGTGGGTKPYIELYNAPTVIHHQSNGNKAQQQQTQPVPYSAPYSNGLSLSSQTPYGPHVPVGPSSGNGTGVSIGPGPPGLMQSGNASATNASSGTANSEEISTIFVVGFPEDMQEREFQNMFTFSSGFEAATLKIPNKEYTSYGGLVGNGSTTGMRGVNGGYPGYVGPNDPYNLVTVNQGGVVIDAGRDGTMTSWPASVPGDDVNGGHFALTGGGSGTGLNMPPRKQIIGFAKFKTREEALTARDVLQGRRVDIDKGAVLKAEMAKKNLHTKRGVGPVPGGSAANGGGGTVSSIAALQQQQHGSAINGTASSLDPYSTLVSSGDKLAAREQELGTLGAMGLSSMAPGRLNQWRDQIPQQDHNHTPSGSNSLLNGNVTAGREEGGRGLGFISTMNLGGIGTGTRGPRERAEDDERRRKEKDLQRLRNDNSTAFDAFHSVPAGLASNAPMSISRHMSNANAAGLLSPTENGFGGTSPMMGNGYGGQSASVNRHHNHEQSVGPWDTVRTQEPNRPRSSSQQSTSSVVVSSATAGSFLDAQARSFSPSFEQQHQHLQYLEHMQQGQYEKHILEQRSANRVHAHSESSSSSIAGESNRRGSDGGVTDAEIAKALGGLEVNIDGKTSPQLPSPGSGASSRNGVDQNPPINTLYVGNLPTSPPPSGFPQDYLEESLRELFSSRAGFRRLCFRQKSNGPMCFVEFEDVPYATKALNDLYGNNLKGLVKGGIRLSYSKNPLGVRTPTSAGSNGPSLQQQQLQGSNNNNHNNTTMSYPSTFSSELQPRLTEEQQSRSAKGILRRDVGLSSPPPSLGQHVPSSFASPNYLASPPPRFYSTSPSASTTFGTSSGSMALTGTSSAFVPRNSGSMNLYGFGLSPSTSTSTFSPFGLSSTPPPQSMIPDHQDTPDVHLPSAHS